MNIKEKISLEAINIIREEIGIAQGNEVFFRGIPDENGRVESVEVLARGNRGATPAIMRPMKKEEVIIHNHPSGYLYPSDADIEVASYYANKSNGGFYIINNDVTEVYVVVEIYNDKNIDISVVPYFEKEGIISQCFKEFEYREEQLKMAEIIEQGFNSEKKVIVEAGTGTGKTLAYLIPGIEWAIKNKKRIIFSTNTINLQEQLLNKDIPLAKQILGYDFKYMLVKGRGNYICNRKYYNSIMGEKPDLEEYSVIQKNQYKELIKWGSSTKTGDKSELLFEVDYMVWEIFQSETDTCLGNKCSYKQECFFYKVRDAKKSADVLITNHHLYFTDLAIRKEIGFSTEYSILPEYGAIVFDEAHNVEKVARDYFSMEVSKISFVKLLNKIIHEDRRKKGKAALLLAEKECEFQNSKESLKLIEELRVKHPGLNSAIRKYFDELIRMFTDEKHPTASIRLKKNDEVYLNFIDKINFYTRELTLEYSEYSKIARQLIRMLRELEDEDGTLNELTKYLERLEDMIANLKSINEMEDDEYIYWIDVNRKKGYSKRVATPLKINNELQKNLFVNMKTIIFTSATIAIGENFKYFKESIGLFENLVEKVIYSPFDYEKQMNVMIPSDFVAPNSREFVEEASEFLKDLAIKTNGKIFILFTSYSTLNYIYYSIRDELIKNGIELFVHGTAPRTQLIEMYKKSPNPVLFGTDSFWEGVDIKGKQLSTVVIIKLPFKVPNDPITEAIIESIISTGKNPFTEYQIPEAIIKFKQGIGRLIRSKTDEGNIIVLDNRIIKKKYGEFFINSFPTSKIKVIEKKEILNSLKK